MSDMAVEAGTWQGWVIVSMVLITISSLIWWMSKHMEADKCDQCWLPEITVSMWDREEYRCRECGTRYRIETDFWRPRSEHRYWVVAGKAGW